MPSFNINITINHDVTRRSTSNFGSNVSRSVTVSSVLEKIARNPAATESIKADVAKLGDGDRRKLVYEVSKSISPVRNDFAQATRNFNATKVLKAIYEVGVNVPRTQAVEDAYSVISGLVRNGRIDNAREDLAFVGAVKPLTEEQRVQLTARVAQNYGWTALPQVFENLRATAPNGLPERVAHASQFLNGKLDSGDFSKPVAQNAFRLLVSKMDLAEARALRDIAAKRANTQLGARGLAIVNAHIHKLTHC